MAQYEEEMEELPEDMELPDEELVGALEVKVVQTEVDDCAEVVEKKFKEAKE